MMPPATSSTGLAWVDDYLSCLDAQHERINKALAGLPLEAIDYQPLASMNTIGVLVVHTCGSARYWLGDVIAGEPAARDRDAEFATRGIPAPELATRLADNREYICKVLASLQPKHLEDIRKTPRHPDGCTVMWVLLHVLEHTALHTGHIQMLRKLWNARSTAST
ncbi:MAG: DUF664 domain-containing protein [Deinococcota bacterium]